MTTVSLAEGASIHADWIATRPGDYGPGIREPLETGLYVTALRYLEAQRQRGRVLKQWLDEVFGKADVLHTPVFDSPTPAVAATQPGRPDSPTVGAYGRFTTLFAYLGLPALAVPVGFQADGMPAAMQLVGRPFAEADILNAAHLYQLENPWHARAPALPG
jgi:aspartyl-tRNA(Asn)/glutamyl-tRNA(Gln) amidotransferase subunit A